MASLLCSSRLDKSREDALTGARAACGEALRLVLTTRRVSHMHATHAAYAPQLVLARRARVGDDHGLVPLAARSGVRSSATSALLSLGSAPHNHGLPAQGRLACARSIASAAASPHPASCRHVRGPLRATRGVARRAALQSMRSSQYHARCFRIVCMMAAKILGSART